MQKLGTGRVGLLLGAALALAVAAALFASRLRGTWRSTSSGRPVRSPSTWRR
jgi:hypothetical protein